MRKQEKKKMEEEKKMMKLKLHKQLSMSLQGQKKTLLARLLWHPEHTGC